MAIQSLLKAITRSASAVVNPTQQPLLRLATSTLTANMHCPSSKEEVFMSGSSKRIPRRTFARLPETALNRTDAQSAHLGQVPHRGSGFTWTSRRQHGCLQVIKPGVLDM